MAKKEYSWNIDRLRGTPAQFIGGVEAPDEAKAIKKAIEEFKITNPAMQKRQLAHRSEAGRRRRTLPKLWACEYISEKLIFDRVLDCIFSRCRKRLMRPREAGRRVTFQERKSSWFDHGQRLGDTALEIIGQCDRLDATKGTRDPKVIALALLSRSLCHFRAVLRLLDMGLVVEARTLTRCIFENLFMQGGLAESGDQFVQKMVDDVAKSRQSRGSWVLGWLDEQEGESPYEEGLRSTMEKLRMLYPKPRAINFGEITKDGSLKNAYLWYKQLSSDAAHPSLEALTRHITKKADDSLLISVEPVAREKDILDTIEWACQALMGVIVGANQVAGPVKAGEKLPGLCDEFLQLASRAGRG
jgi:hypothetical protein